jgi:hypothetical protein
VKVYVAFHRGEFFGHDVPPGPSSFVGVYATREEALRHCWPEGDSQFVEERELEAAREEEPSFPQWNFP